MPATKKKPAKKGKAAAAPAPKLPPIKLADNLPALMWDQVPLKDLWIDDNRDRDAALEDRQIRSFAESIAARGQLQPVLITKLGAPKGRWRVVAGVRRVKAMRMLNLEQCDATAASFKTEDEVLAAMATENLHRQDLNPAEEANAVAHLLEAVAFDAAIAAGASSGTRPFTRELADDLLRKGGVALDAYQHDLLLQPRVHAHAIELVAARLAKSPTWVRDRAFLGRLDGKARDLVLSGELPLASARIIAQVADPKVRDDLARQAVKDPRDTYHGRPMTTERVQQIASEYLFSLGSVPWKLEEPFAGKIACAACPHNSNNNPGLFEHGVSARLSTRIDGERSKAEGAAGICSNHACFREKSTAANGAVNRVATKALLTIKGKPTDAAATAAAGPLTPKYINRSAVAHRVKQKAERQRAFGKPKSTKASTHPAVNRVDDQKREAEHKWKNAAYAWVDKKVNPVLSKWLKARPGAWLLFELLTKHELFQKIGNQHGAKVLQSPAWKELVGLLKAPSWEAALKIEAGAKRSFGLLDSWYAANNGTAASLVELLELDVDTPFPTLDDFLPAKDKAKPEAKAAAKPKAGKAKSAVDAEEDELEAEDD